MFSRLIGIASISLGILWVMKPVYLRNWFLRSTRLHLFGFVLGFLLYPLIHYGRHLGFFGVCLVVICFWAGMNMAGTTLRRLFEKIPLVIFQVMGVLNILTGLALL